MPRNPNACWGDYPEAFAYPYPYATAYPYDALRVKKNLRRRASSVPPVGRGGDRGGGSRSPATVRDVL